MHEFVALVKLPVQDEVHVSVHQTKSKNDNLIFDGYYKYTVHPVDEILAVIKQSVYSVAICAKMPTISNRIVFTLDIGNVE